MTQARIRTRSRSPLVWGWMNDERVRDGRARGETFEEIGRSLGVSRFAVVKRAVRIGVWVPKCQRSDSEAQVMLNPRLDPRLGPRMTSWELICAGTSLEGTRWPG